MDSIQRIDGYYYTKEVFMKNRGIWMGMLVIVLTFGMMVAGCAEDDGDVPGGGKLTLTGIPSKYDGKYAMFMGETSTKSIVGAQSVNSNTVRLPKISGGSVTLTLWEASESGNPKAYTGNDTVSEGMIAITDTDTVTSDSELRMVAGGVVDSIEFKNGSATKALTSSNSEFEDAE